MSDGKRHEHDLGRIAEQFHIYADFVSAEVCGSGHINDTYCATFDQGGSPIRYILQRINQNVFTDPVSLMDNIARVTTHLRVKVDEPRTRHALTLIPTRDGGTYHLDPEGSYWRAYVYVEGASTFDTAQSRRQVYEVARTFGQFQRLLEDLPGPRLRETIPDFHNTPRRVEAFESAVAVDPMKRAASAKSEIDFARKRVWMADVLLAKYRAGEIPERTTHNDTKINNVLLDDNTGEGVCVIDLDTVMPGLSLYDFGDEVRTMTTSAREDEENLEKVQFHLLLFEELVKGYLSAVGQLLNRTEIRHLAFAGRLITFEQAIRFLTDYLLGDVYYKVHDREHNLRRCRTQFRLIEQMEEMEPEMERIVKEVFS